MYSFALDSCMASPSCKDADYSFSKLDDVVPNTKYLGDDSNTNWVSEGMPQKYNGGVLLTMPANSVGTLLSSTHYVWFGKISAKLRTSRGAGVVTAFILMSDVKDEIDFEFIGTDVQTAQSNFYWQGTLNYTNEKNISASSTDTDMHEYTIDWSPDKLTWSVDGSTLRTLNRDDTWNSTTNSYQYPQTPARVQLSLWPAGDPKNGPGTVAWAGGAIDWNSPYMTNGYYSAYVDDVSVQCYDPPPGANSTGHGSYVYNDDKGLNTSIAITDDPTELASLYATGEDPGVNPDSSSKGASPSKTDSGDVSVNTNAQTVPGDSGSGTRGSDSTSGGTSSQDSNGGSSGGSGSDGGGTDGSFSQNSNSQGGSGSTGGASTGLGERALQGSGVAVLVAFIALVVL